MKKLYSLLFIIAFSFISINLNAVTINVSVGPSGTNTFSPNNFTAVVGDDIVFTLASGVHNVTTAGGVLPAGAATISSGTMSTPGQTYTYNVTVAGNYGFMCTIHGSSMVGGFVASATGIVDPTVNLLTSVFPSPFKEKITVKYSGIESIEFINVVGEKVKTVEMPSAEGKVEVDFDNLPAGIYFYRTYKEGAVYETRKIVKAK
jgi:plastocyanin